MLRTNIFLMAAHCISNGLNLRAKPHLVESLAPDQRSTAKRGASQRYGVRLKWLLMAFLAFSSPTYAAWFTLSGKPGQADSDYIQVDPLAIDPVAGQRTLQVRVNRWQAVADPDGFAYRSMTAEATVDCASKIARYVRKTYFADPNFSGEPVHQRFFGPQSGPPLQFDGAKGDHAARLVTAACKL